MNRKKTEHDKSNVAQNGCLAHVARCQAWRKCKEDIWHDTNAHNYTQATERRYSVIFAHTRLVWIPELLYMFVPASGTEWWVCLFLRFCQPEWWVHLFLRLCTARGHLGNTHSSTFQMLCQPPARIDLRQIGLFVVLRESQSLRYVVFLKVSLDAIDFCSKRLEV